MERCRGAFKMLTDKPIGKRHTGKRLLGRRRRRLEDNIRMDLKEIGVSTRNWFDTAQDRDNLRALVNAAFNLRVP